VQALEMEAAAIQKICFLMKVPLIVLKVISDVHVEDPLERE